MSPQIDFLSLSYTREAADVKEARKWVQGHLRRGGRERAGKGTGQACRRTAARRGSCGNRFCTVHRHQDNLAWCMQGQRVDRVGGMVGVEGHGASAHESSLQPARPGQARWRAAGGAGVTGCRLGARARAPASCQPPADGWSRG